ncbi:hypothetical protein B0H16DRAFT_1776861 [Mycena metata]|uniref:Uncharacterized protein n=1 Tax=Mycena metata TaxID=1033252 RepID=A0AAD7JUP0_9AGAR|nr:hypothetical protein B0H16DRAFT_1776861 [Mycena metata]
MDSLAFHPELGPAIANLVSAAERAFSQSEQRVRRDLESQLADTREELDAKEKELLRLRIACEGAQAATRNLLANMEEDFDIKEKKLLQLQIERDCAWATTQDTREELDTKEKELLRLRIACEGAQAATRNIQRQLETQGEELSRLRMDCKSSRATIKSMQDLLELTKTALDKQRMISSPRAQSKDAAIGRVENAPAETVQTASEAVRNTPIKQEPDGEDDATMTNADVPTDPGVQPPTQDPAERLGLASEQLLYMTYVESFPNPDGLPSTTTLQAVDSWVKGHIDQFVYRNNKAGKTQLFDSRDSDLMPDPMFTLPVALSGVLVNSMPSSFVRHICMTAYGAIGGKDQSGAHPQDGQQNFFNISILVVLHSRSQRQLMLTSGLDENRPPGIAEVFPEGEIPTECFGLQRVGFDTKLYDTLRTSRPRQAQSAIEKEIRKDHPTKRKRPDGDIAFNYTERRLFVPFPRPE